LLIAVNCGGKKNDISLRYYIFILISL